MEASGENVAVPEANVVPKRSPLQMEALEKARLKAMEVRKANAELRQKQKAIALAEKPEAAAAIHKRFEEVKPAEQPSTSEQPVKTEPKEETEDEVVYEKKPKKKKRVVVVQESSSSDEEIEVRLPKKKAPARPASPNPFEKPWHQVMMPY